MSSLRRLVGTQDTPGWLVGRTTACQSPTTLTEECAR